jgi:predicted nucleotidyltransferase
LDQCHWPSLPEKYDQALHQAVEFILSDFNVSGIVASGTIIRGNPDLTSDLDIYVIHQESFRQRLQKFFNGVPTEIFVNPPAAVESYFVDEHAARRPLTAHMVATGFVILELDPIVNALREEATAWLQKSPESSPEGLTMNRYLVATLYEDALDVVERDPITAQMLLSRAVIEMINYSFSKAGRFLPRHKDLLRAFAKLDTETAALATRFFEASHLDLRLKLAERIADRTIETRGFFEWETTPEEVEEGKPV